MRKRISTENSNNRTPHYKRFGYKIFKKPAHSLLTVVVILTLNQYSPVSLASKAQVSSTVDGESLVLRCAASCEQVAQAVQNLGGKINVRYSNINALAIRVPSSVSDHIFAITGVTGVGKDRLIALPFPIAPAAISKTSIVNSAAVTPANLGKLVATSPANYNFNNRLTGANSLHEAGQFGEGVVVAVIDSGVANNPDIVKTLSGSVIGGENFVDGADEPSATSTLNDPHGTMVATMIAGHGALDVFNTSPIVKAMLTHAPDSIFPIDATASSIPLIGTAPAASIYAMKVFPANGDGALSSTVLAAMDRALSLKRNFDAGQPVAPTAGSGTEEDPYVYDALNIQVVNLSLGGQTLIPGLELEDILALEMLASGITVVASSGNEGPASLTGGSPGTSVAALSVGAANTAAHERIWLDTVVEPGFGSAYRASDEIQIAEFSSRGPTADGRRGVDVVANGMGNFVQGADGGFYLVAGTSFSGPTVAGAAALLIAEKPEASAAEIRSSIIKSANKDLLDKSATKIDQGKGFLNVSAALEILNNDKAHDELPKLPGKPTKPRDIAELIEDQDVEPIEFEHRNKYSISVNLHPGEVEHILVPTDDETASVSVNISHIKAELPIDQQNVLYGDDIYLTVVDAPTAYNEILTSEFIFADSQLVFNDPQHGYMRLAVMGDYTNAGKVSAKITITEQEQRPAQTLIKQRISDGESDNVLINVEAGVTSVNFELDWSGDWGRYPVNDLDLILIDPDGNIYFDGATLRVPEKVVIPDPLPGVWSAVIDGYQLHGTRDRYELRAQDALGNNLKVLH